MQMTATESRIFDKKIIDKLQAKIFSPHLISNSTAFSFQAFYDSDRLVSLIDILKIFSDDNKQQSKFYFKFCPEEYHDYLNRIKPNHGLEVHRASRLHFNTKDTNNNSKEVLKTYWNETEYFQF